MSLNIYTNKENCPAGLEFVYNIDAAFVGLRLRNDDFTLRVLRDIEQAEYMDEVTFKDRLGRGLYSNCLSTGSKGLLLVHYRPDLLVKMDEVGYNCYPVLAYLQDGNVLFEHADVFIKPYPDEDYERELDITIDGIDCKSYAEVEDALNAII